MDNDLYDWETGSAKLISLLVYKQHLKDKVEPEVEMSEQVDEPQEAKEDTNPSDDNPPEQQWAVTEEAKDDDDENEFKMSGLDDDSETDSKMDSDEKRSKFDNLMIEIPNNDGTTTKVKISPKSSSRKKRKWYKKVFTPSSE